MLDILFNPQKAKRHHFELFLIGVFYSSLSILLGLWIFDTSASIAIVFLTMFSCFYVVQGAIRIEEKKERNWNSEKWLLNEHKEVALIIFFLFLGFVVSFSLWSLFLPSDSVGKVFEEQASSVAQIKLLTGKAISLSDPLIKIFSNNARIILISLVFALLYGAGAIYILVWNASVMGFVVGSIARETSGVISLPIAFVKYFLHGVPEMVAYIAAAIAGGILYFSLIRGDLIRKDKIKRILIDVSSLVVISLLLLVIAAVIEVYISSLI